MEGQKNQEKPIFLPGLSFCHPFAGPRTVKPSQTRSNWVKPMLLVKMPGKYMQVIYNECLTTQIRVVTVPTCSDLFRSITTKKNKSKMAAQDVKNFDRMHKMNRILQWKRGNRSVKLDRTGSGAQAAGQIVSKSFSMNDLKNNQRSGQSNPVKVNQTRYDAPKAHHIYVSRYIDFRFATPTRQS